jgi:transcriptional antiterminator
MKKHELNKAEKSLLESIPVGSLTISRESLIEKLEKAESEREEFKQAYSDLFNKRAIRVQDLQEKVREALDKKSCPGVFMEISSDAILEHGLGQLADMAKKNELLTKDRYELGMLVKQLVNRVIKSCPDNDLCKRAMDYLSRKHLISVLRDDGN